MFCDIPIMDYDLSLFLVPDYYSSFNCKCGDCRQCCCEGWDVAISQREYFELLSLDVTDELKSRLSRAFYIPRDAEPDRYALLNHDWLGNCPLRDGTGLCLLHSEAGEDSLPGVCRLYPRSIHKDLCEATLSNSCEKVIEMLAERNTQLRFVQQKTGTLGTGFEPPYRMSLRMQCIGILQDRNSSLAQSFESVGELITGKKAAVMRFEDCLRVMMSFCMEYSENGSSLSEYCLQSLRMLSGISENEYDKRRRLMHSMFPNLEMIQENLMVNHFFYEKFPYSESREDETEEYESLCAVLCFIGVLVNGNLERINRMEDLVDLLSKAFRVMEHSAFHYNAHVLLDRAGFGEPDIAGSLLRYSL